MWARLFRRQPQSNNALNKLRIVLDDDEVVEIGADDKQLVPIYVRKGDHAKERIISINPIPAGVDPLTLLDAGFAIDGNSARLPVDACTTVFEHGTGVGRFADDDIRAIGTFEPGSGPDWMKNWTLTKAMNDVQKRIVAWLKSRGCEVRFG